MLPVSSCSRAPLSFDFPERTSAHPWIPAAIYRSGSSLLRWRYGTKLVEHAQPIEQPAELRNLAGSDAVEDETRHCNLSAGWRNPLELALMSTPSCPSLADPVIFGDQLFEGGVPVRKGAAHGPDELFERLFTHLPSSREHDCCIGRHQLICRCGVPLIPELLDKPAHERLVLFQ